MEGTGPPTRSTLLPVLEALLAPASPTDRAEHTARALCAAPGIRWARVRYTAWLGTPAAEAACERPATPNAGTGPTMGWRFPPTSLTPALELQIDDSARPWFTDERTQRRLEAIATMLAGDDDAEPPVCSTDPMAAQSPIPTWLAATGKLPDALNDLRALFGDDLSTLWPSQPDAMTLVSRLVRILQYNAPLSTTLDGEWTLPGIAAATAGPARWTRLRAFTVVALSAAPGDPPVEIEITLPDGHPRVLAVRLQTPPGPGTDAVIVLTLVDVTHQRQMARRIQVLEQVLDHCRSALLFTDAQGTIQHVNRSFVESSGYEANEAVGRTPEFLQPSQPPEDPHQHPWRTALAGSAWEGEILNRRKGGETYWARTRVRPLLDATGNVSGLCAFEDARTDSKRELDEARHTQRMEVFGQLAGGVAHDFNNLLTVIGGNASYALRESNDPDVRAALEDIAMSVDRATSLTRQLLLFSRRQPARPVPVSLVDLATRLTRMLSRLLGEHIRLSTRFDARRSWVHADPGMVEQVIINLAVNARDAMPNGGQLSLYLDDVDAVGEPPSRHPAARCGHFARVTVADSGTGIDPVHLPHIFEAFFTTKPVGHGTGLGLATVHGIVQQYRGWIEVYTEVGYGTSFQVYLPQCPAPIDQPPETLQAPDPSAHATILVVEDDPDVRDLTRRILARQGHRVFDASNGPEAAHWWSVYQSEIDLVITDLVMPGEINGRELIEYIHHEKPDQRVLLTTGYPDRAPGELEDGIPLLAKPYTPEALIAAVRTALDGAT